MKYECNDCEGEPCKFDDITDVGIPKVCPFNGRNVGWIVARVK